MHQVCQINWPSHPDRKVVARFDGGRLSSDAEAQAVSVRPGSTARTDGWLCLLETEGTLVPIAATSATRFANCSPSAAFRSWPAMRTVGNDANSLRSDPILKTVCDRLPESHPDLASQPTLSRLENSVDSKGNLTRLGHVVAGDLLEAPQEEPAREDHPGHRQHG